MALDGILIHRLTQVLQENLPYRINKIYQISENELYFLCFNQRRYNLIISCHSVYNRIQWTNQSISTPSEPSHFVMLLRKYLEGGTITQCNQIGLDRIIMMNIDNRNQLGDMVHTQCAIELMGKYANVILIDSNGRIIDALKRIPPFENTKRTIQPGAMYKYPDPHDKANPFIDDLTASTDQIASIFHGFSPLLGREVQYRMKQGSFFRDIMNQIAASQSLFITNNPEIYFHCIPLTHLQQPTQEYPIMEGLDRVYHQKEQIERIKQQTGDSFKIVQRELKRYRGKLPKLFHALDEAKDCDKWREYGDYCLVYAQEIDKGSSSAVFKRFDNEQEIIIPLDPKLDGKQNARKFFQKYHKGSIGQKYIKEQIQICEHEILYFEALKQQLELADIQDAKEIRQELVSRGLIKQPPPKKNRHKQLSKPNFITVKLDENTTIYIGKNNTQNEYLTFKVAQKNDIWFHAKDTFGAHVIVVTPQLNENIIRTAAMLAAYYSKSRYSSSVPVNYTLIKNIKKIPQAPAGLVRISSYQTIFIDPDETLILSMINR